jgi:hypothetical protein
MANQHSRRKKKTPLPLPPALWQQAFESTGNNPLSWRHSAENLLTGARAVRKEVRDFGRMMHSLAAVEALLLGFAIECLLKAIYINGGNTLVKQGKYVHVRNAADHDLIQLAAAAGVSLTTTERRVLRKLTPFILFAGRYPIPKEANSMKPVMGESPRFISREELDAADQLISKRLMSAAEPWTK